MSITLTHIALHVRDLDACLDFYRRYCGMRVTHERRDPAGSNVVWLAEPGREQEFIFVLLSGGPDRVPAENDFSHLGFAVESRDAVDRLADRARTDGCLNGNPVRNPIRSAIIAV